MQPCSREIDGYTNYTLDKFFKLCFYELHLFTWVDAQKGFKQYLKRYLSHG